MQKLCRHATVSSTLRVALCAAALLGVLPSYAAAQCASSLAVDILLGGGSVWTAASGHDAASQGSFIMDAGFVAAMSPKPIGAALDFRTRVQLGYAHVAPSSVQSDGSLYRAWDAIDISLFLGMGFPDIVLDASGTALRFSLFAGAGLSAAQYSTTTLAFAYPSVLARIQADFYFKPEFSLLVALPLEWALRAGGSSFALGLQVGFSYRFFASPSPQESTSPAPELYHEQ